MKFHTYFLIILDRFWLFFDEMSIKVFIQINESYWKTKILKILMKFYIKNMFFESNYYDNIIIILNI